MKVQLVSDLHIDFLNDISRWKLLKEIRNTAIEKEIDVLVVAGDLINNDDLEKSLTMIATTLHFFRNYYKHIIYVPGNHEYYSSETKKEIDKRLFILNERIDNISITTNPTTIYIDDKVFVCATTWFPYDPMIAPFLTARQIGDSYIPGFLDWVYEEHLSARDLFGRIEEPDVWVTHHLPSHVCISDRYKGSPLNCFYDAKLDDLIIEKQPNFVFYGHTHDSGNLVYPDTNTRLICNPRGYYGENRNFKTDLVIEI